MKIKVWGARGSIAVSGEKYLKYGGDTTCVELRNKENRVIVLDAGTGIRELGNAMVEEGVTDFHFLLSHAHWDHLMGFPFFKPLYMKGVNIYFHGCTFAQQSIKSILQETMRAPFFPVELSSVSAKLHFDDECRPEFEIANLCVKSIPLSHPNNGYGFRIYEGDKSFAFFPDNELSLVHPQGKTFDDYVHFLKDTDLLLHDAEYTKNEYEQKTRGWGHSIYTDTVRLGLDAGVDRLILWHLNQERSDHLIDEILEDAQLIIEAENRSMKCSMGYTGLKLSI